MPATCFNCGTPDDLTDDHIPPEGFFPEPKPNNLITVRACKTCNNGFSKDDEAFRLWVSSSVFRNEAGDTIWNTHVIPSFAKRNGKLAKNIQPYLKFKEVEGMVGMGIKLKVPTFSIPEDRAQKFLIRTTKGLLRRFHPEYDYSEVEFVALHVPPTIEGVKTATELTGMLAYDQRGNGVFRFWRGFPEDAPKKGVWVYLFYDGACFVVFHGKKLLKPQPRILEARLQPSRIILPSRFE